MSVKTFKQMLWEQDILLVSGLNVSNVQQWQGKLGCLICLKWEIRQQMFKHSNVQLFECFKCSENKRTNFFNVLIWHMLEKRQKCSTVWMFQMKWNGGNKRGECFECLGLTWKRGQKMWVGLKVLTQTVHRFIERHSDRFVHWIDFFPTQK